MLVTVPKVFGVPMPDKTLVGTDDGDEYEFGSVCMSCYARQPVPEIPEDEDRVTVVCPNCGQSSMRVRSRPK